MQWFHAAEHAGSGQVLWPPLLANAKRGRWVGTEPCHPPTQCWASSNWACWNCARECMDVTIPAEAAFFLAFCIATAISSVWASSLHIALVWVGGSMQSLSTHTWLKFLIDTLLSAWSMHRFSGKLSEYCAELPAQIVPRLRLTVGCDKIAFELPFRTQLNHGMRSKQGCSRITCIEEVAESACDSWGHFDLTKRALLVGGPS